MAACPACGSTKLKEVGPGEYQCLDAVQVQTGLHPSGAQGPPLQWVNCGKRFFDPDFVGTGVAKARVCKCGTYSVGLCVSCRAEVCGQHSRLVEGSRLCDDCQAEREARLADEKAKKKASREEAIRSADHEIATTIEAFVRKMKGVSTTPVILRDGSRTEKRSHLRFADSFHTVGTELGRGWYVETPSAIQIVTHVDTSAAGTEHKQTPGLGILEDGSLWMCTANYEIVGFEPLAGTRDLGKMTHGVVWTPHSDPGLDPAAVAQALADRLDEAAKSPWSPPPFRTRRQEKADRKAIYEWRDEQIYGKGGYKAYRERMYGPETFWDKVKKWIG